MLTEKYLDEEKFIKYIRSLRSRYLELVQLYPDIEEEEDSVGPNCDEPLDHKFIPREYHSWGPVYSEYLEIQRLTEEAISNLLECNQLFLSKNILLFVSSYNNLKYIESRYSYYLDLISKEISSIEDERLGLSSTYCSYHKMHIEYHQRYNYVLGDMISSYIL